MKITHGQFVIEIFEENNKFYATANMIYDCGCTGYLQPTVFDAIKDVTKMADNLTVVTYPK